VADDEDDDLYVMSPSEIVLGFMPGYMVAPPPPSGPKGSPREVLERIVRDALSRPPCGVAFSGGRDSSTVLAVATHVARRDGLPEPVPIMRVFPGITEAEEGAWQERVVRHLGLGDWHRVVLHDEVDVIGPLARARLVEHGVLWPPNLAGDVPLIEAVPGGAVIDGEGGDEVLGDAWHRVADVRQLVRAPWPPRKRRLRAALEAAAPARVRTSRLRRDWGDQLTWLTPAGRELVLDTLAREEGERPLSYSASLRMVPRKRKQVLAARNRRLLAAGSGVEITSPLLHQDFIDALARRGGALGTGDRTAVLRDLVPDLLPDDVLARTSKGMYTRCYMGRPTCEFAVVWSGDGVDHGLVVADELRRLWATGLPAAATGALLQAAWLAEEGRKGTTTAKPSRPDLADGMGH
jgi:asparagine synthase (glutamine-hydrolysing)